MPRAPQDEPPANDVAKANNPLASATAFNVHNYYIGELTGTDEPGNQFWLRVAKPFSIGETNWLMRASLPVNHLSGAARARSRDRAG